MANSVDPDRSSLFWIHAICFYTYIVSNVRQVVAADDFSRMHLFLGALRVKQSLLCSHSKVFVFEDSVFGPCFVIQYFVSV